MRLDLLLVRQGLAESRNRAQHLIEAGAVRCGDRVLRRSSELLPEDAVLSLSSPPEQRVGRGGGKLEEAFRLFHLQAEGITAADIGASTGGFTELLLKRGASRVYAIDVGHGQLHPKLQQDPRVISMERTNARNLTPQMLGSLCDMIVVDVSFISQRLLYPAITALLRPDGIVITLIKPQFEAGRADVGKGGIVRSVEVHRRVILELGEAAAVCGLFPAGLGRSPYPGGDGNCEFLLMLTKIPPSSFDLARETDGLLRTPSAKLPKTAKENRSIRPSPEHKE